MRILLLFNADADPDPTFHPGADPDPSFKIKTQTLKKMAQIGLYCIPYILSCHLQIDSDPDPANLDADQDPDFYMMQTGCGT
jgi:hypothetical protein